MQQKPRQSKGFAHQNFVSNRSSRASRNLSNSASISGYDCTGNVYKPYALGQCPTPNFLQPPILPQYSSELYPQMQSYLPHMPPQQQQLPIVVNSLDVRFNNNTYMQSGKFLNGNTKPVVINSSTAQTVLVAPFVMSHQPQFQQRPTKRGKLRSHALEIIDPVTRKNILEDMDTDKVKPHNASECLPTKVMANPSLDTCTKAKSDKLEIKLAEDSTLNMDIVQNIEQSNQQTGDSFEKDMKGKTQEHIDSSIDYPTITPAALNCVHETQPQDFVNQQVPQQQQLDNKPETDILQPSLLMPNDNLSTRQEASKESSTKETDVTHFSQSVEESGSRLLPQQEQVNALTCVEQEQIDHINSIETAIVALLNESTESVLVKDDLASSNKNTSKQNNNSPKGTKSLNKTDEKKDKKRAKYVKKNKKKKAVTEKKSCNNTEPTKIKDDVIDGKGNANSSTKDGVANKQTIDSSSTSLAPLSAAKNPATAKKVEAVSGSDKNNEDQGPPPTSGDKKQPTKIKDDVIDGKGNANSSTKDGVANKQTIDSSSTSLAPLLAAKNPATAKKVEAVSGSDKNNEDQGPPPTSGDKKQYTRDKLMQLREVNTPKPTINPKISSCTLQDLVNVQTMPKVSVNTKDNCRGSANSSYQNIKLNEADNAWRPRMLTESTDKEIDPEQKAQLEKQNLNRRVRGILNKLTPEKFEPLVEEIIKLNINTMEKMKAVMILVFEKAIDEPKFSVTYAILCQRLISIIKTCDERAESGSKANIALFHRSLLSKAEEEFKQNVIQNKAKEEKLMPIREMIKNCTDENEKNELKAQLEEEEQKIRRRSGGTVRFIGELFKLSMLTGKIINSCIQTLLQDPKNEDMLEYLCKLLTTVGQNFEQTPIPKTDNCKFSLNGVIKQMENLSANKGNFKLSSRIRFMMLDVIDLRNNNWQSKRNEVPKTLEQITKEANSEKMSAVYYGDVLNQRNDYGVRNFGRSGGHEPFI